MQRRLLGGFFICDLLKHFLPDSRPQSQQTGIFNDGYEK